MVEQSAVSPVSEMPPVYPKEGGIAMEKQASATGAIAGIEWVDWYDCYKAYKAEKIRAETKAKADETQTPTQSAPDSIAHSPSKDNDSAQREALLSGAVEGLTLTPVTSRDDGSTGRQSLTSRRRSMSIRSGMSALDPKASSLSKRTSIHDRHRQSSGGSARSSDTYQAAVKRKRNLVTKMEGWWSSVKSNFTVEPAVASHKTSGLYDQPRIPSAPSSRRNSVKHTALGPSLMPPALVRRTSSSSGRSLRSAASQKELGSIARGVSPSPASIHAVSEAPLLASPPPALARESDIGHIERLASSRPGLEARRNQPSLRLDLDSNVLSVAHSRGVPHPLSSRSQGSESHSESSHHRKVHLGSRSSSYGFGSRSGTAAAQWDPTLSPTVSSGSAHKGDRPVAPGADLTVASVREHIKQRVNAAKEQCDNTLRRVIQLITIFEDQRIAAIEDESRRDYFDAFSDSPVIDALDSEDDGTIPPFGLRESLKTLIRAYE